jgi:enoyl-CoA hydratase/carnithine racemase
MDSYFSVEISQHITTVTFDRPPVNAFSYAVYEQLIRLADRLDDDDETRVVIFRAPDGARAWIGGAELSDFVGLDYEGRLKRYELVNRAIDRFRAVSKPVIAAMESHAVGAGMTFAAICDIRIASETAFCSMPEIDRGLTSGGGAPFLRLGMPNGKIRELIFTGRRFHAAELHDCGFIDYVTAPGNVMDKARDLAEVIAGKSLPALQATKFCANAVEGMAANAGRALSQEYSARLTAGLDAKEGIRAFFERRDPRYSHRTSASVQPDGEGT